MDSLLFLLFLLSSLHGQQSHPVVTFHAPADDAHISVGDDKAVEAAVVPLSVSVHRVPRNALVLLQLDGNHQKNITGLCSWPSNSSDVESGSCHVDAGLSVATFGWHAAAIIVHRRSSSSPGAA